MNDEFESVVHQQLDAMASGLAEWIIVCNPPRDQLLSKLREFLEHAKDGGIIVGQDRILATPAGAEGGRE